MLAVTVIGIGIILLIYGVLIILRVVKTSEDDNVTRYYAGIKGIAAGLLAIFLGLVLYFV